MHLRVCLSWLHIFETPRMFSLKESSGEDNPGFSEEKKALTGLVFTAMRPLTADAALSLSGVALN